MTRHTLRPDDRGQAYTLEALIAALLLVTAVLFALQAVVITPTSAGTLDRDVQGQLHQQATDVLVTAENDRELSQLVRYWNHVDSAEDAGFADEPASAGNWTAELGYANDTLPVGDLDESLNRTFGEGIRYNIVLAYEGSGGDRETTRLVFQGTPGDEVVTASYTVTLTDDQRVTGNGTHQTIGQVADSSTDREPPIPDVDTSGPFYNVVEVRLVLW